MEVIETWLTCRLCIVDRGGVEQVFAQIENERKKEEWSFVRVSAGADFLHLFFVVWKKESRSWSLFATWHVQFSSYPSISARRKTLCLHRRVKKNIIYIYCSFQSNKRYQEVSFVYSGHQETRGRSRRKLLVSLHPRLPATQIIPYVSFLNFLLCSFYVSLHTLVSHSCLSVVHSTVQFVFEHSYLETQDTDKPTSNDVINLVWMR